MKNKLLKRRTEVERLFNESVERVEQENTEQNRLQGEFRLINELLTEKDSNKKGEKNG